MTAAQRQELLIEDYLLIPDARERFQWIVESGATGLAPFPEEDRRDENLVPGCVSRTWLSVRPGAGATVEVRIDSESPALAGIGGLLRRIYSGASAGEILETRPDFIERLGIDRHLTPTRLRGLGRLRATLVERAGRLIDPHET